MQQENCGPCKDLGIALIAHYGSVPAGKSPTGIAVPAKCYYHHFNLPLPKSLQDKILRPEAVAEQSYPSEPRSVANASGQTETPTRAASGQRHHSSAARPAPEVDLRRKQSGDAPENTSSDQAGSIPRPPLSAQAHSAIDTLAKALETEAPVTTSSPADAEQGSKTCKAEGCGRALRGDNESGYCAKHRISSGGSRTPRLSDPSLNGHATADSRAGNVVQVSELQLDRMWVQLNVEQKARLIFGENK